MTRRRVELEYAATGGQALEGRFRSLGDAGERAMTRLRRSVEPVNPALRAVNATTGEMRLQVEGLAASAGPLGSVLRAVGPAGLVAAAGLGAASMAARGLISAGEAAERQQLRLQAVLRATGHASGQTAAELERMAVSLARDTQGDLGQARSVIARTLTRTEIGPEIFERTLRVSQDLAEVLGRDLAGAAEMVGRAMSSPTRGMESLRDAGIFLSQQQEEQIRLWEESGELMRAQTFLLESLEQRVGGAGAAAGGGLSGAWGTLNTNIRLYVERAASALGITERLQQVIDALGRGAGRMADDMIADRSAQEIEAATAERMRLEAELERARRGDFLAPPSWRGVRPQELINALEEELASARELEERLLAEARQRAQQQRDEEAQAEEGRARALAERRAQQILTIERKLEEDRLALRENALERIRLAEARELETLRNLRAQSDDPEELERIDQAIAARQALTEREIAQLSAASEQAAQRRAQAEAARAAQQRERNLEVLAGLEREIELLGIASERERERLKAQDQAAARLTGASPAEEAQARALAGQAYDEERAQRDEQTLHRMEEQLRLLEAQRALVGADSEMRRVATAVLQQELSLRERGIDLTSEQAEAELSLAATIARTSNEISRQDAAYQQLGRGLDRGFEGMMASLSATEDRWQQLGRTAMQVLNDIIMGLLQMEGFGGGDSLGGALAKGIASLFRPTGIEAVEAAAPEVIAANPEIFHSGGVIGRTQAPRRRVPAALFENAPRFHRGGLVGRERAIIAEDGEEVLTRDNPRHRDNFSGLKVSLQVINNAGVEVTAGRPRSDGQGGVSIDIMLDEAMGRALGRFGSRSNQAARGAFGLKPVTVRR